MLEFLRLKLIDILVVADILSTYRDIYFYQNALEHIIKRHMEKFYLILALDLPLEAL